MTAAIVTEFSRDPYDPATVFKFGANGDVKRRDTPGQLWERVAELSALHSPPARIGRFTLQSIPNPGPRFTLSDLSGIIRAGERIK